MKERFDDDNSIERNEKKPQRLIDLYSIEDTRLIKTLGGVILGNFLKGKIPEDKRIELINKIKILDSMTFHADELEECFGKEFKWASEIDMYKYPDAYVEERDINHPNSTSGYDRDKLFITDERFEEVFEIIIDGFTEMLDYLDEYVKTEKLTPEERAFIDVYRIPAKDMLDGNGYARKSHDSSIYFHALNDAFAGININKPDAKVELNVEEVQKEDGEIVEKIHRKFAIDGAEDANWKDTVKGLQGTPIFDTFTKGINVATRWDDAINGRDADRSDMLELYSDYRKNINKQFGMSKEDFDKIYNHESAPLQNDYGQFVNGSRAPYNLRYETQARLDLLKAGFPLEDITFLSVFYIAMEYNKQYQVAKKEFEGKVRDTYDEQMQLWKELTAPGPMTEEERKRRIGLISDYLDEHVVSKSCPDLGKCIKQLSERKLSKYEKLSLSGNARDFYDALNNDEVDPTFLSSSDEFKKMKEALKKLSEADVENDREKYIVLRNDAKIKTQAYLNYKKKENRKGSHKRSKVEDLRVKHATAILDGLTRIEKADMQREHSLDDRIIISDDMDIRDAKAFSEAVKEFEDGRKKIADEIRKKLREFQKINNRKENILIDEEILKDNKYYSNMIKAMKNCIEVLEDPYSSSDEVLESITKVTRTAKSYKKDKDSFIFGRPDPESVTGMRYNLADQLTNECPAMTAFYEQTRLKLDRFKDKYNESYVAKNLADMKDFTDRQGIIVDGPKEDLYAISLKQAKLKKLVEKFNPFMGKNYRINYKVNRYHAIKPGMSTKEMANAFIAKKYLDEIFDKDVDAQKLNALEIDLKENLPAQEAEMLAKSTTFKKVVSTYGDKTFGAWEKIDKKVAEIEKLCQNNIQAMLDSVEKPKDREVNIRDYISVGDKGVWKRGADAITNYMLCLPIGRTITEAMAADPTINPQEVIDSLSGAVQKHISKSRSFSPMHYIDDYNIQDTYKVMLNAFKRTEKEIKNNRNNNRRITQNAEKAKVHKK